MSELAEAKLTAQAAKSGALPTGACVLFDSGKQTDRTIMDNTVIDNTVIDNTVIDNTVQQATEQLPACGADVIGATFGRGIEPCVENCRQIHRATDRPIRIKAHAGVPAIAGDAQCPALVEAGASLLGGDCCTGPEFIVALRQRISP